MKLDNYLIEIKFVDKNSNYLSPSIGYVICADRQVLSISDNISFMKWYTVPQVEEHCYLQDWDMKYIHLL